MDTITSKEDMYVLTPEGLAELTREIFKNVSERINERIVTTIGDNPLENQVLSVKSLSDIINDINNRIDNIKVAENISVIGIKSIEPTSMSSNSGEVNIWTITFTDDSTYELKVYNGTAGTPGENGQQGEKGEQGEQGIPGEPGANGLDGKSATITIGSVTEGDTPAVTNSGTENDAVLDFVIPAKETIVEKTVKVAETKQVYSSDETVIGTWLGNPLFRKVFTGTATNNLKLTDTGNVDKLVNQYGSHGYTCTPLPFRMSDTDYCMIQNIDNNLTLTAEGTYYQDKEFNITAEYTKKVAGDNKIGYFDLSAIGYTGENNEKLVIPKLFVAEDGEVYNVTKIDSGMFNDASNLMSVTIPNTVTAIGNNAFQNCTNLIYLTIEEGTTEIGNYSFQYCENLTYVNLPNTLQNINKYTFQYCKSLESIVIPDGVTAIYSWAFQYCENLREITLPAGITRIDSFAFQYCTNLTTVNFKGTEEQWAAVTIGNMNNPIKDATVIYNYTE